MPKNSQADTVKVRSKAVFLAGLLVTGGCKDRSTTDPLSFNDAKSLSTPALARKLLGERLGKNVIDAVRRDHDGRPKEVEFYTQPVLTDPRLNGICRTDVITVEYNWVDSPQSSAPVKIAHVQATPRYKSFPMPEGEPGTAENEQAQAAACAGMTTATDAFRAPSAGDAQWLAKIAVEYARHPMSFRFTCSDFADATCQKARQALSTLKLGPTVPVEKVDCLSKNTGDQLDQCYRLTFPYRDRNSYLDNQDEREGNSFSPEWTITILAGIKDGMAPVRIISLDMLHERRPIVMY